LQTLKVSNLQSYFTFGHGVCGDEVSCVGKVVGKTILGMPFYGAWNSSQLRADLIKSFEQKKIEGLEKKKAISILLLHD